MGVKVFNLQDGKEEIVTWFDGRHVQFHGGHSCARKDIGRFYGDQSEVLLRNVQAIVDNYLADMKKFDYPGKPPKTKLQKKRVKDSEIAVLKQSKLEYGELCRQTLFKLQPPESLAEELKAYNAGVWCQKEPSGTPINKDSPWYFLWNQYIALEMNGKHTPREKIEEWIKVCRDYKDLKKWDGDQC